MRSSRALPIQFGEWYSIIPHPPLIQTLPPPPVPFEGYLHLSHNWAQQNAVRLKLAWKFLNENDELLDLLYKNISSVQFGRYNLEVYFSIAELCRQNLLMIKGLEEINDALATAQEQTAKLDSGDAVAALDQALDMAGRIRDERNQTLDDAQTTW